MSPLRLRLVCNAGLEQALEAELRSLGLESERSGRGHCLLSVPPATALALLRDLRCATRVIWQLAGGLPPQREGLLRALAELPWERWLPRGLPWAARATGRSAELGHTHFSALLVKDGVRDRHRRLGIEAPPIAPRTPRVIVDLRLRPAGADVGIDLGASALHRRSGGDRGRAPIREDVAAGIAWLAGATDFDLIFDPFCGSGTLLAEACCVSRAVGAGRALDSTAAAVLPALRGAFERVPRLSRTQAGTRPRLRAVARDLDPRCLAGAERLFSRLPRGAFDFDLAPGDISDVAAGPQPAGRGLLLTNPPWGRRLEDRTVAAWEGLGRLARALPGWRLAALCGDRELSRHLHLRASRRHPLRIGGVDTRLLIYEISR